MSYKPSIAVSELHNVSSPALLGTYPADWLDFFVSDEPLALVLPSGQTTGCCLESVTAVPNARAPMTLAKMSYGNVQLGRKRLGDQLSR